MYRELQYQKTKLRSNLEMLRQRTTENALLESVVKDYQTYEKHLNEQDEAHASQLQFISEYIHDIMETNELTEDGLIKVKKDHDVILKLMHEIKNKIHV